MGIVCGWGVFALAAAFAHDYKVISAVRADQAPEIDGRLDDAVWAKAEVSTDFIGIGGQAVETTGAKLTEMRLAYDETYVYLAMRCAGDARMCEIFFDPGRTMAFHYQYLVSPDGTFWGMGNARRELVRKGCRSASRDEGGVWTFEFAFPHLGKAVSGATWGFNLVRDDRSPYCMWQLISEAYSTPQLFGVLLIGGREEWIETNVAACREMIVRAQACPDLEARAADCLGRLASLSGTAEERYEEFVRIKADADRLSDRLLLKGL